MPRTKKKKSKPSSRSTNEKIYSAKVQNKIKKKTLLIRIKGNNVNAIHEKHTVTPSTVIKLIGIKNVNYQIES